MAFSQLLVAFPWVETSTGSGVGVWFVCVFFLTGAPEGSTERSFMEKPRIEPATPGLQGIDLSPTPRRLLRFFSMGK